jgi:diketogulonate reductase-like aldo/keto reductase
MFISLFLTSAISAEPITVSKMVKLNDGNMMPSVNLGTCCGSDPNVGLKPWLTEARPVMGSSPIGIDTAWDYSDQTHIASILKSVHTKRSDIFLTTKIPTGFGNSTDCNADPQMVIRYMKENLQQLGVDSVDLALLHHPCSADSRPHPKEPEPKIDAALWKGLLLAQKAGMVKSIGVSNYNAEQLKGVDWAGTVPAINQCHMSVGSHDDATIAYCLTNNIKYEAYGTMRSCYGQPWTSGLAKIATAHSKSISQVCLRWVLQRGAIMAIGTGSNATTIDSYTKEDLDLFSFELTDDDVKTIDAFKK